jgi:DNA polymerase-1
MELIGVSIDSAKLRQFGIVMNDEARQLEISIHDTVGEKFNINSSKQLQEILFDKLKIPVVKKNKTGLSVDNEVLEIIGEKYAIAKDILEYRSLQKLLSTYVEGLLKMIHPVTGRIHTTYRQLGTTTGRMSSENPNLQNIPSGSGHAGEIRSCFIPSSTDYSLLVADYSQVELRILASLSGDENLIHAFQAGEDIHTRTARFLF